jgi:hypothetical protein
MRSICQEHIFDNARSDTEGSLHNDVTLSVQEGSVIKISKEEGKERAHEMGFSIADNAEISIPAPIGAKIGRTTGNSYKYTTKNIVKDVSGQDTSTTTKVRRLMATAL